MVGKELNVSTVDLDATSSLLLKVLLATERGETPVLGDNDLLATGELVLRATESLQGKSTVWMKVYLSASMSNYDCRMDIEHTGVTSADTQDDLADVDTGDSAVGLTPSTTHTGLQSIGTSARQHLVDADDVVRVGADTQVETFLSGVLDQVPVVASLVSRCPLLCFPSILLVFRESLALTCWRKYGRPQEPRSSAARTRSRRGGCTEGSHRR